jgi:hypothetical protein
MDIYWYAYKYCILMQTIVLRTYFVNTHYQGLSDIIPVSHHRRNRPRVEARWMMEVGYPQKKASRLLKTC